MSDARENYKAVFGVYPNETKPPKGELTDQQRAHELLSSLQRAAIELHALWDKPQIAGISAQSREHLRQIQTAAMAIQRDLGQGPPSTP